MGHVTHDARVFGDWARASRCWHDLLTAQYQRSLRSTYPKAMSRGVVRLGPTWAWRMRGRDRVILADERGQLVTEPIVGIWPCI